MRQFDIHGRSHRSFARGRYNWHVRPAGTGTVTRYRTKVIKGLSVSGSNSFSGPSPSYSDYCNVSGTAQAVSGMPNLRINSGVGIDTRITSLSASMSDMRRNSIKSEALFGLSFWVGANKVLFGTIVEYTRVGSISNQASSPFGWPFQGEGLVISDSTSVGYIPQQTWEPDPDMECVPTSVAAFLHGLRGTYSITFDVTLSWTEMYFT